ncbi:MAG TPA: MOSC domain-containing protein [Sphingomicrobium sp.]|nr:MOSC domain-containing protein [Sphingomicrobium sp.]
MSVDRPKLVVSVQVGKIAPLGPQAVPSGFVKHPIEGPVRTGELGLQGDQQADLRVHGGPEKAVYAYAASNYPAWLKDFPEHRERLVPGAFGENLTIDGMSEADLCVGDIHSIGTALLQVCQPRQPCFKFGLHFEDKRMPRAMVRNGRAGWYYRVIEAGALQAGDEVRLIERPHADLPFQRLIQIVNRGQATNSELDRLASANGAASSIRTAAKEALAVRLSKL